MGALRFRIWFGERAASAEELARVEDIEVTQEMDAFWEARVRMFLCLDANGAWLHWPGEGGAAFSRVRVEIDLGSGRFVALIDGPLVSIDAALDAQPGRSAATMVVRDDSAFLNRDEEVEPAFEHRRYSDIATELFGRFAQIASTRVDATTATPETTTRRGTVLQFLRELGAASGATGWQTLTRIEFPSARKTLLIGLNQCILLSLAMVVLAGLVGAGGLGAEVTRGLTRMEMGLGLRSGLSIVAVAIFMDRLSRRALG